MLRVMVSQFWKILDQGLILKYQSRICVLLIDIFILSKITRIMVHQRSRTLLAHSGLISLIRITMIAQ